MSDPTKTTVPPCHSQQKAPVLINPNPACRPRGAVPKRPFRKPYGTEPSHCRGSSPCYAGDTPDPCLGGSSPDATDSCFGTAPPIVNIRPVAVGVYCLREAGAPIPATFKNNRCYYGRWLQPLKLYSWRLLWRRLRLLPMLPKLLALLVAVELVDVAVSPPSS